MPTIIRQRAEKAKMMGGSFNGAKRRYHAFAKPKAWHLACRPNLAKAILPDRRLRGYDLHSADWRSRVRHACAPGRSPVEMQRPLSASLPWVGLLNTTSARKAVFVYST